MDAPEDRDISPSSDKGDAQETPVSAAEITTDDQAATPNNAHTDSDNCGNKRPGIAGESYRENLRTIQQQLAKEFAGPREDYSPSVNDDSDMDVANFDTEESEISDDDDRAKRDEYVPNGISTFYHLTTT